MKKRIALCSSLFAVTAMGVDYFSVIGNDDFKVVEYPDETIITEWKDVGLEYDCKDIISSDDYYKNVPFTQTEECKQDQERTITKKKDGQVISEVTEYQTIKISTDRTEQGTHLEASCKDILNNGYSVGSGNYELLNGYLAHCDMTTENGGWTKIATINHTSNKEIAPDISINDQGINYTEALVLDYGTTGDYYTPDSSYWMWQGFDLGKMVFKIGNTWTMPQITETNQSGCHNITKFVPISTYNVIKNKPLCQGNGTENRPHLCAETLKITLPTNEKISAFNDVESIYGTCTADNIMHYNFEVFVR